MDDRFINRELSWLAFNERVLDLATEARHPAARTGEVLRDRHDQPRRVLPGPRRRAEGPGGGEDRRAHAGRAHGHPAARRHRTRGGGAGRPSGRRVPSTSSARRWPRQASRSCDWSELEADDRKAMTEVYEQRMFPVLTPLAVDPSHPFPYISDLALSVAAMVRDPETGERRFARVKVPDRPPRGSCRSTTSRFLPAEELIVAHLEPCSPGMIIEECRAVPRHAQRRPHARGGGGRRPARGGGDGAAPPPVQPRRAPRGRRRDQRRDARTARPRARSAPDDVYRLRGTVDFSFLWQLASARPPRPQGPPVAADHAGAHRRRRRGRASASFR